MAAAAWLGVAGLPANLFSTLIPAFWGSLSHFSLLEPCVQITASLLDPVWSQWGADTHALTSSLPAALAAPPAQQQPLLLVFERWLLTLKVGFRHLDCMLS